MARSPSTGPAPEFGGDAARGSDLPVRIEVVETAMQGDVGQDLGFTWTAHHQPARTRDANADRKAGIFRVEKLYPESCLKDVSSFNRALAVELERLCEYTGCERWTIER